MPVLANAKHELFAQAVAEGSSATQAYREHVADSKTLAETCMTSACRLMSDARVLKRVQELRSEFADVLENRLGIRRETIARYLVSVFSTPIGEVKEGHVLCQEYSETPGLNGTSYRYKMPSKLDAIEKLIKMAGWYAPEKVEVSGSLAGLFAEITGAKKE